MTLTTVAGEEVGGAVRTIVVLEVEEADEVGGVEVTEGEVEEDMIDRETPVGKVGAAVAVIREVLLPVRLEVEVEAEVDSGVDTMKGGDRFLLVNYDYVVW